MQAPEDHQDRCVIDLIILYIIFENREYRLHCREE